MQRPSAGIQGNREAGNFGNHNGNPGTSVQNGNRGGFSENSRGAGNVRNADVARERGFLPSIHSSVG